MGRRADPWLGPLADVPARGGRPAGAGCSARDPDEVAIADSTTVNVYRLAIAALDARPGRRVIVTDRPNFPTDRYVLEGIASARGLTIRWLDARPGRRAARPRDVADALADDVALVTLSHVNYRSAAIADLPAITSLAHDAGALVLWDLSHSGGSVPVGLREHGVDLAAGCTYKYLNGGPGAPAYVYVRRELQARLRQPIRGWFGQRDQFAMGQGYDPEPDIRRYLVGTPGILGLTAADVGISLSAEAGIEAIRAKGIALTEYAIALHDAWLAPLGCTVGSPRASARRGAHVAVRHPEARRLTRELIARKVIPDFREPDSIRLGLSPLTTSFGDVHRGVAAIRELLR